MLGKKIVNPGGVACTTDTTQILDAGSTQSLALYRFEDNTDDTASSTGKFNKGGIFNGSSSKITLPAILPTNSTADSSVSFWFKYNGGQSGTGTLFSSFGGNTSQPGYHLGLEAAYTWGGVSYPDGSLFLTGYSMGTGSGVNGTTSYADGKWHHVVVTYDFSAGVLSCFVDNPSSATLSISFTSRPSTIGPFSQSGNIGYQAYGGPHRYAKCSIDQFRIFNKDLTSTERTTLYNETTTTANTLQVLGDTSCIATYTLEGNADDLSTNNYDGTATSVIYDYNGTASSSVTYATGKFGKAAVFNGSSSEVTINNFATLSQVGISMWVNIADVTSSYGLITKYASNDREFSIYNYQASNGFIAALYYNGNNSNSITLTASDYLTNNTWHHIAYTADGVNKPRLYIDGVQTLETAQSNNNTYYSTSQPISLGSFAGSASYFFDGKIDQVRVFKESLSPGEISSLYNETATSAASGTINDPSTVAYYKMADATDETGSYNGTATNVDFNVQGKYGFAGKFNGSSSYIATPTLLPTNNFSFSCWFNPSSFASSANKVIYNQNITSNRFYISIYDSGKIEAWNGSGTFTTSSSVVNLNQWHNIVYTASSSTGKKIYVDGTEVLTNADTGNNQGSATGTNWTGFGKWYTNVLYLDGKLDQVRIFNKVISAAEVTKLYNEIQCANTIDTPESYFNTKLYTGNGGTQAITGVGFAPGMTWIKARSVGYSHSLQDTLRGPGTSTSLYPDANADAGTYGMYGQISAFGDDGFTVASGGHGSYPVAQTNQNGVTYASWNWKTADSTTTNNDGATQSTVRASQESGFSVVKYTGTGSATTVGHSLNKKPNLIIFKNLGSSGTSDQWPVYASPITADFTLYLSYTYAAINDAANYNDTEPTSSVFTVGTWNGINKSSIDYVAYCFANIDGYQRISSYVGNGSTNGPFVYTGFEPAWLMVKRTDAAGNSWAIFDNKRVESDGDQSVVFADTPSVESDYDIDFTANGFIIKATTTNLNASGGNYIFLAIAANPDTTAPTKANSFNTVLYSGTNGSQSITGAGFKPDMIWFKNRTGTHAHGLVDSVRDRSKVLYPNDTYAENTSAANKDLISFDSDGFSLGPVVQSGSINTSGGSIVSWNWKALDHDRNLASINNDGSITSLVSANTEAGFSIVKYISTGTSGSAVGHGLSSAPAIAIFKCTSNASTNWITSITNVVSNKHLYLNTNSAGGTGGFSIDGTNITLNNTYNDANTSGRTYIAYCWHSVAGHSSIGTYTGNASTTGPSVTVGFRPSWVLIKKTSNTGSWYIFDAVRAGSTTAFPKLLYPNLNNIEYDTTGTAYDGMVITTTATTFEVDFSSAWTDLNELNETYLYMAFK